MQRPTFFSWRSEALSKAIYYGRKFGRKLKPDEARRIERVRLAQEFPGWTLDYIDSLDSFDLADIWGVLDGQNKAGKVT